MRKMTWMIVGIVALLVCALLLALFGLYACASLKSIFKPRPDAREATVAYGYPLAEYQCERCGRLANFVEHPQTHNMKYCEVCGGNTPHKKVRDL